MSSRKRINFKLVDAYKRIFGNLHVPVKFVVPKSAEWPTEFHGYNIGKYIGKIRSRGIKDRKHYVKEDLHELDAMGLDWVNFTPKIQKPTYKQIIDGLPNDVVRIFEALVAFEKAESHVVVPPEFRVPTGNPQMYPPHLWGLPLGKIVDDILNEGYLLEYRERLSHIKFPFNHVGFDILHIALETYKELYGDVNVHRKFAIEFSDERFPEITRGIKLGKVCQRIKQNKMHVDHQAELAEMGFTFDPPRVQKYQSHSFSHSDSERDEYNEHHGAEGDGYDEEELLEGEEADERHWEEEEYRDSDGDDAEVEEYDDDMYHDEGSRGALEEAIKTEKGKSRPR